MAHGYKTQQKGISEIGSAKPTNLTPITAEFGITPITAEPYFSLLSVIGFSNCTSYCVF
jgi:hypothetical protein